MPKHNKNVEGVNLSLEKLADSIGYLSYDSTRDFLKYLADNLREQADADLNLRNRKRLAAELYSAADSIEQAYFYVDRAWEICEPYMRDK